MAKKINYRPNEKNTTRIVTDSEMLDGVQYEVVDNHVIVHGGASGTLAVNFNALPKLVMDLYDMKEVYGK
jgi:hypothetical protein